jgi:hypothetical protein
MRNPLFALAVLVVLPAAAFACDELGELKRAMAASMANVAAYQKANVDEAIDEAWVDKDMMEEFLTLRYFPGLWDMRDGDIQFKVPEVPAYHAVSARLPFLAGKTGATITFAAKDRAAQFAALKADYTAALKRAGDGLRGLGENPASKQRLWALAEWGVESSVNDAQVLSRAEKDAILAPAPAPQRDPHE